MTDEANNDEKKDDAPIADAPITDAPITDAPITDAPNADAKSDGEKTDALFEALWAKVLEDWDNDKPHQALLSHALDKQLLPELAGRYRKLQDDPEKAERAKKKINGIVVAATQMLMATKTPPPTKVPLSWTLSAAAMLALIIALLFYKLILGR